MITLILSPIIECKNIESDADCRKYALCGWKDWKENCALFCGECGMYLINSVQVSHCDTNTSYDLNISSIKNVAKINTKGGDTMVKTLELSSTDLPLTSTFQSSSRNTDVSPEDISERFFITIKTAKETLKRTTQKFLRSALLPLSRSYRADRMYSYKRLSGERSTDTIDGRTRSIDGNRYAQIFANSQYYSKIYSLDHHFLLQ